ncbi:MAG: diheme cytochrome c [Gammaproteobacteria bacterium]|nr:diheme cytochrome c [Gammaproteobacteria bacterium]
MMKKWLLLLSLLTGLVLTAQAVQGDEDEHEHEGWHGWFKGAAADIKPVRNERYRQECASCHMAYQPGLLPAQSWKRVMNSLDNHFGENAELLPEDMKLISEYLQAGAADTTSFGRSGAFARGGKAGRMRITESPYFLRKHDEVPKRFLKHEKIGSFSNCVACHRSAEQGVYDEHDVNIPGVGRWDD